MERQADDVAAWEEPIFVHWAKLSLDPLPFPVSLPSGLIDRVVFFAELHKEASIEDWLIRIIQERIDSESDIFAHLAERLGEGTAISLPFGLAERVAFFAERHRAPSARI